MSTDKAINILKGAILLEMRGKSFYEKTAMLTKSRTVREIFETMVAEEGKHIVILSQHYTNLVNEEKIVPFKFDEKPIEVSVSVLSQKIQNEITASDYEAAAISAAMAMEEKAVEYYSTPAETAADPLEKELYNWLANWEKTHLQLLSDLDNELKESVWYDNNFWPM